MSYNGEVRVLRNKLISCMLKQLIGHQALDLLIWRSIYCTEPAAQLIDQRLTYFYWALLIIYLK